MLYAAVYSELYLLVPECCCHRREAERAVRGDVDSMCVQPRGVQRQGTAEVSDVSDAGSCSTVDLPRGAKPSCQ